MLSRDAVRLCGRLLFAGSAIGYMREVKKVLAFELPTIAICYSNKEDPNHYRLYQSVIANLM